MRGIGTTTITPRPRAHRKSTPRAHRKSTPRAHWEHNETENTLGEEHRENSTGAHGYQRTYVNIKHTTDTHYNTENAGHDIGTAEILPQKRYYHKRDTTAEILPQKRYHKSDATEVAYYHKSTTN